MCFTGGYSIGISLDAINKYLIYCAPTDFRALHQVKCYFIGCWTSALALSLASKRCNVHIPVEQGIGRAPL
ncbi:hypothetical protein SCLCIDRAFT_1208572 [Scleroderma citrinum Foug A]|uniref:Uncharacterized protein n=1 Tax=Scleroderma citrinum Foug A TaxID=1036808 RepID=A0A0C3ELT8_9AGAM|nr:hypothetical protein SCLCIDRAFT_1208572 [Scleroderma citrinum Foug A]